MTGDIYKPTDYGKEPYHWKPFTLKEAVMISDNVVAVQVNHLLIRNKRLTTLKFGFPNLQPVLSLPLGSNEVTPMSMAAAYAVFANQGRYNKPTYIVRVEDANGVILEEHQPEPQQIISRKRLYYQQYAARCNGSWWNRCSFKSIIGSIPAAGKTGTTDEFKDAWFVGYTPRICCAVWVGYDRGKNVDSVGGVVAGPIWANFMASTARKYGAVDFVQPDQIKLINICLDSGQVASQSCERTSSMAFLPNTEPASICYYHASGLDWLLPDEHDEHHQEPWWERWTPW